MLKVNTETATAVFHPKFQKPALIYTPNFLKLNYTKPTSQLNIKIQNIFKRKVKSKLLSYENEIIFF